MKTSRHLISLVGVSAALVVLMSPLTAYAAAQAVGGNASAGVFTYAPPVRGAPPTRVGGGTRGGEFDYQPPERGAPLTRVGGGTRGGEFEFAPSAERGAPATRVGGGTRGGEFSFTPEAERGAPVARVGGGTRGRPPMIKLSLDVLSADTTGHTLRDQPTVYWYVSAPVAHPVEFTVIGAETLEEGAKPLLNVQSTTPVEPGMHALRLADYGIKLKPDHDYQWFVAIVRNPNQRSNDILAGGRIRKVSGSQGMNEQLSDNAPAKHAEIYARSGIWYDAIDALSKMINADPGNRELRTQRSALLEQVGLPRAAAYDRAKVN